jgi:uncharacterized protein with FMN-binding domain
MKKTILVLVASAAGFIAVWRFEPAPLASTVVASAPATPAPGSSEVTVPGSSEDSRFGTVQVQLVLSGGKITDVRLLREPTSGPGIDAIPALREEALRAQSAEIDTVSGATQTSDSYVKSLRTALDAR